MGRGDRPKVRWASNRQRKKKARELRKAATKREARENRQGS